MKNIAAYKILGYWNSKVDSPKCKIKENKKQKQFNDTFEKLGVGTGANLELRRHRNATISPSNFHPYKTYTSTDKDELRSTYNVVSREGTLSSLLSAASTPIASRLLTHTVKTKERKNRITKLSNPEMRKQTLACCRRRQVPRRIVVSVLSYSS